MMFRNKAFYCKFSILIILMSGLLACATDDLAKMYDGDKRPDKEIAKILLPSSLEVAEVNNKSIKTPYNPGGFQTMGLLPGSYKIRIFYKEFWGAANAGAITVSDVFDFDMKLEAGKEYVFKHNGPSDLIDADIEKSVKDIKIWLYQSDTKIEYQSTNRVAYGNFINRALTTAAAYSAESGNSVQPIGAKQEVDTKQIELEQLQNFWKSADDRQRSSFKTWVANRSFAAKPSKDSSASSELKSSKTEKSAEKNAYQQLQHWWEMADDKQRKSFSDWLAKRSVDGKGLI